MLIGGACVALPLARGGTDLRVEVAALITCAAAAVLTLAFGPRDVDVPRLVIVGVAITAVIGLQLVPLPEEVLRIVSPAAADLFQAHLGPLGLFPAARPISLDPPATYREFGKSAACLFAFMAVALLAMSQRRKRLLLAIFALAGTAVSAVGLGAALGGFTPLLEPRATFANPNHLAGFLNLTAFTALGFAARTSGSRRLLWTMAFVVSATGVFLSLSRAGIGAFFVGSSVYFVVNMRRARSAAAESLPSHRSLIPIALGLAVAVAAFVALDPILSEMQSARSGADEAKVQMWRQAIAMIRDYPVFGIGRGAFSAVFPEYKLDAYPLTFTHLENEWLQATIDLGLPLGLLAVGLLVWTWFRAASAPDVSRPEIGVIAGLAAVAVHNSFDFSLEILGMAVPFSVALGLVARRGLPVRARALSVVAITTIVAILALGGFGMYRAHPCEYEPSSVASAATPSEVEPLARAALMWHPADFLPAAVAGVRLASAGWCDKAMPWLGRAMQRNPTAPEPHRAAAGCLWRSGRRTAAVTEFRLAYLVGDVGALDEALARFATLEDVLAVVPDLPDALQRAGSALATTRPAHAEVLLRRAWEVFRDEESLAVLSRVLLLLGRPEEALAAARDLQRDAPAKPSGYLDASAALRMLGRADDARGELELGASRIPGRRELLIPLANLALEARRYVEAHRIAEQITATAPADIAAKRVFVARTLQSAGRLSEALASARTARDAMPGDLAVHNFLADLCVSAGRFEEAIAVTEAAAALPESRPGTYDVRLRELRQAQQRQLSARTRARLLEDIKDPKGR